jgi:hypothetical protein
MRGVPMTESIDDLIRQVQAISSDPKYEKLRRDPPRVQVMVGLGRSLMGRELGYNMRDYFTNMEVRLVAQLKSKIFSHGSIDDDTVIAPEVGYDYGAAGTMESAMFGVPSVFDDAKDPFCAAQPVIHTHSDLGKLRIPDFHETEPMPLIHEKYHDLCALVDGRLRVTFPGWTRSPWSVATFLRGFNDLYMDVADEPGFVSDLLDFIAECRIHWETQRCEFMRTHPRSGEDPGNWFSNCYVDYRPVHISDVYSDETDGNSISPSVYEKTILPSELKLAEFYGGVRYYHSCGNLTPLLGALARIPGLSVLHVSSWTGLAAAYAKCAPSITLQKVMHPQDDVMKAGEADIRAHIKDIMKTVPDRRLLICADAIYEGSIDKVRTWLRIARETVDSCAGPCD